MTASAIQGDREKCLDSGMNNYLAKPVRAQTLKALLESYLNKERDEKKIPDLQSEAKKLVQQALSETGSGGGAETDVVKISGAAAEKDGGKKAGQLDAESGEVKTGMRSRPASVRSVTQRWLGPNGKDATTPPS
jgi:DNA-binding response OmpR family regulator